MLSIRKNKVVDIIKVDQFFAKLENIDQSENLHFKLYYDVSLNNAIKHNGLLVETSLYSSVIPKNNIVANSTNIGSIDTARLIDAILHQTTQAKNEYKNLQQYLLVRKVNDLTSYVSNNKTKSSDQGKTRKVFTIASVAELHSQNKNVQLLTTTNPKLESGILNTTSSSLNSDTTYESLKMIKLGIDPSTVSDMTHNSVSCSDNVNGTLVKTRYRTNTYSSLSKLQNVFLYDNENVRNQFTTKNEEKLQTVEILEHKKTDIVKAKQQIVIEKRNRKNHDGSEITTAVVFFKVLNMKTKEVLQVVSRVLNISEHIEIYETPIKPPIVSIAKLRLKNSLQIKQIDKRASRVNLYKKSIKRKQPLIEDYSLIGTYDLSESDASIIIPIDKQLSSMSMYRAVPIGKTGILGHTFTNVIATPDVQSEPNSCTISTLQTESGIKLELLSIPFNAVSVQFVVRNLTKKQKTFSRILNPIKITDSIRMAGNVSVLDKNVSDYNAYEHAAIIVFTTGLQEISGNVTTVFLKPKPGIVDTVVSNLSVTDSSEPNVTFSLNTNVIDTTATIVKSILDRDDISKYFDNDLKQEREFFNKLLSHNVQRVDLITGERVDFGIVNSSDFSDTDYSSKLFVQKLVEGRKYRYEIYTLIRSPETMFESLKTKKIDSITGKPYEFHSSKFLHPIALQRGVLVSSAGLKTRFGYDEMYYGSVGLTKTFDISFIDNKSNIIDVNVEQVDVNTSQISWRLTGDVSNIDHFIVMKELNDVRTIVGRVHSEFDDNHCKIYHSLTKKDIGNITYLIKPIYNNYSHGKIAKSKPFAAKLEFDYV